MDQRYFNVRPTPECVKTETFPCALCHAVACFSRRYGRLEGEREALSGGGGLPLPRTDQIDLGTDPPGGFWFEGGHFREAALQPGGHGGEGGAEEDLDEEVSPLFQGPLHQREHRQRERFDAGSVDLPHP